MSIEVVEVLPEEPKTVEPNLMALIAEASTHFDDSKVGIMQQLVAMKFQMEDRDAEKQYNRSMILAQGAMRPIWKNRKGERSPYADLEFIDRYIRPIYTEHGFVLTFNTEPSPENTIMGICKCLHRGGHHETYRLQGGLDIAGPKGDKNKTPIQAAGSTIKYIRRYLTEMVFNLVTTNDQEDDDGGGVIDVITEKQYSNLLDLLNGNGRSEKAMIGWINTTPWGGRIKTLLEIPVSRYQECVNILTPKKDK